MNLNFKEPRIFLILLTILTVAVILFYFVASMVTSVGYQTFAAAETDNHSQKTLPTIILDAGHGGEDPGAIANGVIEKEINLSVVEKIADFLKLSGYPVVLTRTEDRLLYNSGEENQKKYYDLYNRVRIAKGESTPVFVSIHMNKFPMESCFGLQSFYSLNNVWSKHLAEKIQEASKLAIPSNTRVSKPDENTIFVLKHLDTPAVLVECGFLSNTEEASLLSTEAYKEELAFSIYNGIISFLEEYKIENELYLQ